MSTAQCSEDPLTPRLIMSLLLHPSVSRNTAAWMARGAVGRDKRSVWRWASGTCRGRVGHRVSIAGVRSTRRTSAERRGSAAGPFKVTIKPVNYQTHCCVECDFLLVSGTVTVFVRVTTKACRSRFTHESPRGRGETQLSGADLWVPEGTVAALTPRERNGSAFGQRRQHGKVT